MRAARFASLLIVSVAALPACDDDTVVTSIAPDWLEWSDSAVAGAPFGVRLRGINDAYASDLRVEVRVAGDTVTIAPYTITRLQHGPRNPAAPLALAWYDTLVWVPAITATTARIVVIRAPSALHTAKPPWPLRTFGTITVSVDTPVAPHMRSVGVGSGFRDSFGCYLVDPASLRYLYVSADQPPAWAPGFTGLAYGRIDPVLRSVCRDDAYVIQVDSIIP